MSPKKTPESKKADGKPYAMTDRDRVAVKAIADAAAEIYKRVLSREKPDLKFPVRSLSNVRYDPKVGYFEIGRQRATRTLTVGTAKSFAQTLRMMALSKLHIETNRRATKREAYYISKNWDDAKFDAQEESDTVMDDVEAMFSVYGVNREMMRFKPDEHGGSVAGELVILDSAKDGKRIRIDCTGFGSGSYTIPSSVEHLQFETKATFILVIETDGTFERLNEGEFWKTSSCILVEMKGVPSRSVRRFVRRLADERKIPVYAFTDGDPYGYANIYRTLKVGSGNAAHINKFFCVPQARFLGVTPQDIIDWDLPTHELKEQDIKRAKDALKNDPFFNREKAWVKTLEQQIAMGQRVEQQAFAKHGLDFVMDEYLPTKLKHREKFLP